MVLETITAIAGGIVSIAKAIPAADRIYQRSVELYYNFEQRQDESNMSQIQHEREGLVASLKQPGLTDDQKRAIRRRLIALSGL